MSSLNPRDRKPPLRGRRNHVLRVVATITGPLKRQHRRHKRQGGPQGGEGGGVPDGGGVSAASGGGEASA